MTLSITIDHGRCTLCGFCVDACPVAIFQFDDGETAVLIGELEQCLACRNCEDHCRPRCLVVDFPEWPHRSSTTRPLVEDEAAADLATESRGS